jgi:membrane associated rhomboid family serine protease
MFLFRSLTIKDNAPVTKVVIGVTVAINLVGALLGSRRGGSKSLGYGPSSNELLLFKNWWRFITGPFVFTSVGELFFGIICMYVFRLFERQWGSQKYAVCLQILFILTTIDVCVNISV